MDNKAEASHGGTGAGGPKLYRLVHLLTMPTSCMELSNLVIESYVLHPSQRWEEVSAGQ